MQKTLPSEELCWQRYLDSWVTQSFTQTTSNQNERGPLQLHQTSPLVLLPSFKFFVRDADSLWLADLIARIRIDSLRRFLEQPNTVLIVSPKSTWVSGLNLSNLRFQLLALVLFSIQVSVSDVFLAYLAQQFLIHQQIQRIIMGANCCKIFSTEKYTSPSELQAQLQKKTQVLDVKYRTKNDKEFTYFLGVFELRMYAQLLRQPEYMDDKHPRFSASLFNEAHRQYSKVVQELGQYVEHRRDPSSAVQMRVKKDASALEEARSKFGFAESKQRGCLVKFQLQGVDAHGIGEIEVHHHHQQKWSGKFQQSIKISSVQTQPYFIQFAIPEVAGSSLKLTTKPRRLQLKVQLDECYNVGKTTFCQVSPWKNGDEGEGLVLRIQLFDGLDESEKVREMAELHKGLQSQFETVRVAGIEEITQRVERHRSSLNQQYDLNNNSMF